MDIPKTFTPVERAWLLAKIGRAHNRSLVPTRETTWQLRHRNPAFKAIDDQATDFVRTESSGGRATFEQIKTHMAAGRTFNVACVNAGVKSPAHRASFSRRFEKELALLVPKMRKQQVWKQRYLAAVAQGLTLSDALEMSGVSRNTVYEAKARDPLFCATLKALETFNRSI